MKNRNLVYLIVEWSLLILRVLLVAIAALTLILLVFDPEAFDTFDLPVNLEDISTSAFETIKVQAIPGSPFEGATIRFEDAYIEIQNKGVVRTTMIIAAALVITYVFWSIQLLLKTVQSVKQGNPFQRENVRRLYQLGLVIVGFEVLIYLGGRIFHWYLDSQMEPSSDLSVSTMSFGLELLDSGFFTGLIVLIIAEVFKKGVELKEEQDLTI